MTESVRELALQDVFQELLASCERPDAVLLEDFTQRYPQFAAEITDFAVEWVLQDELPAEDSASEAEATSAVPAAMQRFRARRETLAASGSEAPELTADPFAERPPAELQRIASTLGLDKTLMAKLRDRKIVAETIPDGLRDDLATQLQVPIPVIADHLAGPATIHLAASFKATGKPAAGSKETFTEAVQRSTLSAAQKQRWLRSDPAP
ncbi:MAG: hypothetical protein AAF657_02660 [Acidobacteriota bacterium]